MKRLILGTPLGRGAMALRNVCSMAWEASIHPEVAGTIANDHLASFITARMCRENKIFIDVGSHIGSVVAEVSYHCKSAKIIAFEAIPEKIVHLRRKFPNVEFFGFALGDSEGEVSFYVNTKQSGYSSLGRPSGSDRSDLKAIQVPLKRLDQLVSSNIVDVIKIDVEGAELGVLRGADRVINESRPTIMFESGPSIDDGLGYTKQMLWEWFAHRRYAVLVPNRVAHDDQGLTQEGFIESHLYPRRTTNYFAVPIERREAVRHRARDVLNLPPLASHTNK